MGDGNSLRSGQPAAVIPYEFIGGWRAHDTETLPALHKLINYETSNMDDRASDWLLLPPDQDWPEPFEELGPRLLGEVSGVSGIPFTAVCYQAYLDGTSCGWHHDRNWGAQAILSLGITRTFGLRNADGEELFPMRHGDLLIMPPGFQDEWEHNLIPEKVQGERCSLVFRSPL